MFYGPRFEVTSLSTDHLGLAKKTHIFPQSMVLIQTKRTYAKARPRVAFVCTTLVGNVMQLRVDTAVDCNSSAYASSLFNEITIPMIISDSRTAACPFQPAYRFPEDVMAVRFTYRARVRKSAPLQATFRKKSHIINKYLPGSPL